MPDFNLKNAEVVNFHHDNLRFWLNRGVDGFRFDAVGNLVENGPGAWLNQPENYTLMNGVRQLVAGYGQRFMVCEGPDDPIGFGQTTACGSAFGSTRCPSSHTPGRRPGRISSRVPSARASVARLTSVVPAT